MIRLGRVADQNHQNYILRALGQLMLYVDGMNGIIAHNATIQWLYELLDSPVSRNFFPMSISILVLVHLSMSFFVFSSTTIPRKQR